ncbi:hypothetical protein [Algoriphagus sp.]|uniref:hypothetical protein n=1 Tax=Algoriphagus sp. TaxID=1872435 RepID=UPI003918FC36
MNIKILLGPSKMIFKMKSQKLRGQNIFCALLFISLTLFSSIAQLFAQQTDLPKETVRFSTPKTLYLVGEKIWFDAEVKIGQSASPSQVLYAELVDRFSNSVSHTKVPLEDGKSANYLLISDGIPSDQYLLRVYTRISPYLDLDLGIAQQFVTVINPKIPPKLTSSNSPIKQGLSTAVLGQVSPSNPKSAESFQISFTNTEQIIASGISISNRYLDGEQIQLSSQETYASIEQRTLLPELFGHILESKVPKADTTLTYFLSLHGKQSALYTDRADESGQILFDAGGLSHWDRLIIQLEDGAEMEGLEIISPVITTKFKEGFEFPSLTIPPSDLDYLSQLQKAAVIETYYLENYSMDSLEIVTGFVADHTYFLDDYTRFETVETVIREYVPSVFVRSQDKRKEFRLVNEAVKSVFETNPLILIDAMPLFNSDLLSTFNPKFIAKLEVLNREFYLNERVYPGVLSFTSFENNFGLYPLEPTARFFDYLGLQPNIELDKSQFRRPKVDGKFPDYRSVLFWGKSENVPIQSSILSGDFVLWIRYLDESGRIQVSKNKFTIAP